MQFKAHIKFTNDDYTTFGGNQKVKSVDDEKDFGHFFIYSVQQFEKSHSNFGKIFGGAPSVDFTLWVTNEKLDEIAKDTKYESGIEDTDDESSAIKKEIEKSE